MTTELADKVSKCRHPKDRLVFVDTPDRLTRVAIILAKCEICNEIIPTAP